MDISPQGFESLPCHFFSEGILVFVFEKESRAHPFPFD